jgi:hypothetical protein
VLRKNATVADRRYRRRIILSSERHDGRDTPVAVLFHESISELDNDVDRLALGVAFYLCLARDDRSVIALTRSRKILSGKI